MCLFQHVGNLTLYTCLLNSWPYVLKAVLNCLCTVSRAFGVVGFFPPSEIPSSAPFSSEAFGHTLLDIEFFCTVKQYHRDQLNNLFGFCVVYYIVMDRRTTFLISGTILMKTKVFMSYVQSC